MKKRLFAVILAMSCLMTACAPKEEAPKATQPQTTAAEISQKETTAEGSAAQPAQTAGEKVLTIGTPYTLDTFLPWQFTSDGDRYVISNIYECLFEYDANTCIPGLAESYTNPDDCTWDVKIRDNAYWQTGNDLFGDEKVPVTAAT